MPLGSYNMIKLNTYMYNNRSQAKESIYRLFLDNKLFYGSSVLPYRPQMHGQKMPRKKTYDPDQAGPRSCLRINRLTQTQEI